ncbi:DUF2802 domain-containing protein [Halopseudomonas phragmitis]|uniref:DUF2802 domain-containing protein n=2 Tax=Pseudomonadaceae TaxID=135621 RepID=A0A1V0B8G2_9GAMM|nr:MULTISPECIES: DUF2802 domain-containing protein [Pseudomonadaceae]AQZ96197.1 hypothetical protein BVH74_16195 [Halopseudomonas phragmitis]
MMTSWETLLAGLLLGLLLAGLLALGWGLRRQGRRLAEQEQALRQRQEQLARDLASFQQGSIRMGETLQEVSQQLKRLEDKQLKFEQQDPHTMPYNQAARLVSMGASVEDLTQSCGLSKAEAELVVKLHAARRH